MRVELRDVGKRFGSVTALRSVSFELAPGERAALIGPNGSGKSTLARVVAGLLACTGTVRLDGLSPVGDRARLIHRLVHVPQIAPQLAATVGELARVVCSLRDLPMDRVAGCAAELGLDIAAIRRRALRDLSGGMRQKLLLALALATEASLMILDEPTASLDIRSRHRFFELVAELPHRPSILLSSHRLEEIRHLVDRILMLEEGTVVFDGDAHGYLQSSGSGILELMADSRRAVRWLEGRGFRRGATGWWTRRVQGGQRIELVEAVVANLGRDLHDIAMRDTERILDGAEDAR